MKKRIDQILLEKKLAESREKAKDLIKWGNVFVDGKRMQRPSQKIEEYSKIELKEPIKYVSRAGYKLERAIEHFKIEVKDKICLDVGSSTGGFIDYLLQKGVKKVYALEIAKGQLHQKLMIDNRVINMDGIDARKDFELIEKIDFCSIDVTFAPINEVLNNIKKHLKQEAEIIALIKPPFELRDKKEYLMTRKKDDYKKVFEKLILWCKKNYFKFIGIIESPIKGKKAKQKEFLIYLKLSNHGTT